MVRCVLEAFKNTDTRPRKIALMVGGLPLGVVRAEKVILACPFGLIGLRSCRPPAVARIKPRGSLFGDLLPLGHVFAGKTGSCASDQSRQNLAQKANGHRQDTPLVRWSHQRITQRQASGHQRPRLTTAGDGTQDEKMHVLQSRLDSSHETWK